MFDEAYLIQTCNYFFFLKFKLYDIDFLRKGRCFQSEAGEVIRNEIDGGLQRS